MKKTYQSPCTHIVVFKQHAALLTVSGLEGFGGDGGPSEGGKEADAREGFFDDEEY